MMTRNQLVSYVAAARDDLRVATMVLKNPGAYCEEAVQEAKRQKQAAQRFLNAYERER